MVHHAISTPLPPRISGHVVSISDRKASLLSALKNLLRGSTPRTKSLTQQLIFASKQLAQNLEEIATEEAEVILEELSRSDVVLSDCLRALSDGSFAALQLLSKDYQPYPTLKNFQPALKISAVTLETVHQNLTLVNSVVPLVRVRAAEFNGYIG